MTTDPGRTRRLRVPEPVAARRLAIGIDIGGTKVAGGLVDPSGAVLQRVLTSTPSSSPVAVEDAICDVVGQLSARAPVGQSVEAVGIGAAGWVDTNQAIVRFSPHLAWRNEPLKERLSDRLAQPVLVDNDANAAAWAEFRFGAGRNARVMVMVTLGTGIGGALVIDGRLFRGRYGMAGEFGHMTVVPDGHWCPCGNRGCWEQYASGNGLVRDARALLATGSPAVTGLLAHVPDGDPEKLRGADVTAAATAGDPVAIELIGDVGTWLGRGLANLAAALDPDLFVIGGGVSGAGEMLRGPAQRAFERTLTGRGFREYATIALASFGNDAGLVGAADLARHSIQEPPGAERGFWPRRRTPGRRRARLRRGLLQRIDQAIPPGGA